MKTTIEKQPLSIDGIRRRVRQKMPVSSRRTHYYQKVWSSLGKILGVFLIVTTLVAGGPSIGSTVSFFNDTESSIGNMLRAGIVDFRLSAGDDSIGEFSDYETSEGSGEHLVFEIDIDRDTTSLPFFYSVRGEIDENSTMACNDLRIVAEHGDGHYGGLFSAFTVPAISSLGEWYFKLSLPSGTSTPEHDGNCRGNIVFSTQSETYTDEERYAFRIYNKGTHDENLITTSISVDTSEAFPTPLITVTEDVAITVETVVEETITEEVIEESIVTNEEDVGIEQEETKVVDQVVEESETQVVVGADEVPEIIEQESGGGEEEVVEVVVEEPLLPPPTSSEESTPEPILELTTELISESTPELSPESTPAPDPAPSLEVVVESSALVTESPTE